MTVALTPSLSPTGEPVSRSVRLEDSRSQADVGGARILVVEDEYFAGLEIEAALAEAGYDVVGVARSAAEAIRIARSSNPRLVLMDVRLAAGGDGIDAACEIFNAHGVRSIFATAQHDPATQARAQAAAPIGWLFKPYSRQALLIAVRHALARLSG